MGKHQMASRLRRSGGTAKSQRKTVAGCGSLEEILAIFRFRPWGILKEETNGRQIYLDYDNITAPSLLKLSRSCSLCSLHIEWIRYDRTNRGWHVICRFTEALHPAECVALQAVLGSDSEREKFNLARVIANRREGANAWKRSRSNILFERKVRQ
jgi:hypothetical protein